MCEECSRLLRLYGEATDEFARRAGEITKAGVSCERDLFQSSWEMAETARKRCVDLRRLLTLHRLNDHAGSF